MSVARDSAGGRLHPPLLVVLPWSLAVVLVMLWRLRLPALKLLQWRRVPAGPRSLL